ncbi:MAG: hypothetical protein GY926_04140 [bacterium]|nr:hypothetical protein [bacterium]
MSDERPGSVDVARYDLELAADLLRSRHPESALQVGAERRWEKLWQVSLGLWCGDPVTDVYEPVMRRGLRGRWFSVQSVDDAVARIELALIDPP